MNLRGLLPGLLTSSAIEPRSTERTTLLASALEMASRGAKSCSPCDESGGSGGEGWRVFGLPTDAGDGFDYNRDHWLWLASGRVVSERAMLSLSTVWSCVRLLSQTLATLPLGMYRRQGDGDRVAANDHPLYAILHNQPNAEMTATDFWQVLGALLFLRGNAVSEIDRIGDRVVGLTPLPCVTWQRQPSGRYLYTVTTNGRSRQLDESQVWHIPAFTLDGRNGLSPIFYGANVFGSARAIDLASSNLFRGGMKASGFVTMPQNVWLTESQRNTFKGELNSFTTNQKAGKSFLLEGGADYHQLTMNPDDAQMLETRSFSVEEICRWFGVPPTLIGHGDKTSNWGTGLEQQNQSFLTYSLSPWLKKYESSIWTHLISPADKPTLFAEFAVEGLLRADSKARSEFYSAMTQNGIMTRDEARSKENLPQMGGNAEVLTVQAALLPLDAIGNRAAKPGDGVPVIDPSLPVDATAAADAGAVQQTALNGAQVMSLQQLLQAAADGTLPLDTVRAAIRAAFPLLSEAEISAMILPLVAFEPNKPEPAPAPFDGGAAP
jgi:HK97 family phage portal protein